MKQLIKLNMTKKKAKIRDLFKSPLSAIFMILMIGGTAFSILPVFFSKQARLAEDMFSVYTLLVIGFSFGLVVMILLQKRMSLFFEEDSYYMFIGPFNNRQILGYAAFDSLLQSLLTGLFCGLLPVLFLMSVGKFTLLQLLTACLSSILLINAFMTLLQITYVKELISQQKSRRNQLLGLVSLLVVAAFIAYNIFVAHFDVRAGLLAFITSKNFYWVPLIGWAKLAINSSFAPDYLGLFIGLGLPLLTNGLLIGYFTRIQGNFYEQAMIDAVDYTDYYKKALAGKDTSQPKQLQNVTIRYKQKEGALLSKNWLILLKSRQFLTKGELIPLFAGLVFCFSLKPNFYLYTGLLVFYLINTVSSSSITEELKSNYIYLIPGHPLKKLLNILVIPFGKTLLFCFLFLLPGALFLKASLTTFLLTFILLASLIAVFHSANVAALRLVKSRSNIMLESALRMLVIGASLIPSALITLGFYALTGNINTSLILLVPVITLINLLLTSGIFYLCQGMMNGNAYTAD
ncbi:putative ABC exporter domain-containing protein [uncultured Vagococcus sp.]|uniref:putative ABC exporter domain-containing protein n=1 Tax=uncultured Vagococcus sp. TaxID=189676 RepID=UPI0028D79E56|nr:putative ABC exporter domain-containing protein [uncultured Vagococcus sp.]